MTWLAHRSSDALAHLRELQRSGLWPPVLPSSVLIECLTGDGHRDAGTNRLVKTCDVVAEVPIALARRAATLRTAARRGSAVDALVVATAEPGGVVLTGDPDDLRPLADGARGVVVRAI